MTAEAIDTTIIEKKQRISALFERLLPLVDAIADKFRLVMLLGILVVIWIGSWLFFLKNYSFTITFITVGLALVPLLIIFRFWWSLVQLRDLPSIADQMLGDTKNEIRDTFQGIKSGTMPKMGILGATKGLWSIGSMAREAKELLGSYVSIAVLINPLMLILGMVSLISVGFFLLIGATLVFFI